jgi:hypothetical protein
MARGIRRKCKHCLKLFRPDPRTQHRQRYCSAPACRAASKAASQARWLAAPESQGYFRDSWHVDRVKAWRRRHPGYWRKRQSGGAALQDVRITQPTGSTSKTAKTVLPPLQELITAQPAVLIGLSAHSVGTPLQDEIAHTTKRLLRLGRDILALNSELRS